MTPQQMESELASLRTAQMGLTMALIALIRTHQDFERFQLELSATAEHQLSCGVLAAGMSPQERQRVATFVEGLCAIPPGEAKTPGRSDRVRELLKRL